MQKFSLALIYFLFLSYFVKAQNVNVSATHATTSGSYPTLKAAFDAINAGTHQGGIAISIVNNTTETATAQLNSYAGPALFTSLTIQPSGGAARTINGNLNAPLIDFNSSDYVTIDGFNTSGNSLTFINTNTGTAAATLRFRDDATNNIVRNCNIYGSSTSATTATIVFSTGTVVSNDYNTINNNNIGDASNNLPFNSIYSTPNNAALSNDNITINANNIYNYFATAGNSSGIYLDATAANVGSSIWTITNNKFYQTGARNNSASPVVARGIRIGNAATMLSGSGYTITGNVIGYAASNASGVTNYGPGGNGDYSFTGIEVNVGNAIITSIQNNTIAGIAINSSYTGANNLFAGIVVNSGLVNVGNTTGNKIGLLAAGINITTNRVQINTYGIYTNQNSGTANISNNAIINVNLNNTVSADVRIKFTGIYATGTSTYTIASNTIGRAMTATQFLFYGIEANLSAAVLSTIDGNTVEGVNVTNSYNGPIAMFAGIYVSAGLVNIGNTTGNTIGTLANSIYVSTTSDAAIHYAIYSNQVGGSPNIKNNIIQNCTATSSSSNPSSVIKFVGISVLGNAGYTIATNTIGRAITATGYCCYGIEANVGNTVGSSIQDNTIAGVSVSSAYNSSLAALFAGIYVQAGTVNIGNVTGNKIGTAANSIFVSSAGNTCNSFGIYSNQSTASTSTISNNVILNCTYTSSVSNNANAKFSAIFVTGTNAYSVSNNNITAAINTTDYLFYGIEANLGTTVTSTVNGNTIAGITMTSSYNGTKALFAGIYVSAGIVNIGNSTGNNIGTSANSVFLTTTGASSLSYGIYSDQSTLAPTISKNIIQNILLQSNIAANSNIKFSGIYLTGGSGNFITNNTVGNRINATNYVVNGIELNMTGTIPNSINDNTIAGVDITTNISGTLGVEASPFVAINVVNGNANIGNTTGNKIGTSIEYVRIAASGNRTHNYGIKIGITLGNADIGNNKFENIGLTSTAIPTADWLNSFVAISTSNIGSYNIFNNSIGSTSANSITLGTSNTIIPYTFNGIVCSGNAAVIVTNNIVRNVSNATSYVGANSNAATVGILINSPATTHSISNNIIHALNATSTLNTNVNVVGIVTSSSVASGSIFNNRIYGLTNTATGTTNSIAGFMPNGGNWTFFNNMISLSNLSNTNGVACNGIFDLGAAGSRSYYFNSIHIEGSSSNNHNSVAFQFDKVTGSVNSRNNIFDMRRTGSGKNYAIINSTGNFSGYVSDYNILNAPNLSAICNAGVDRNLATWRTVSTNDLNSFEDEVIPFVDQSIADLHLISVPCDKLGRGLAIGILIDYDNETRKTGVRPFGPEIGADEISKVITWTGAVNTNWNNAGNWTGAVIPNSINDNVYIPNVVNKPVINIGEIFQVASVGIATGAAALTNNGTLKIYGSITATNNLNTQDGTLEFNSACNQQMFAGVMFKSKIIKNIHLNNRSLSTPMLRLSTTLNDTLKITGNLSFGNVNNVRFETNNNLTLVSTASATANVNDITNNNVNSGNEITGNVNVERFIPNIRKWRLLAWPTNSSQTAKQSWMENASTPNANPKPGFGCIVTDEQASWSSNNFDSKSLSGPSVKYYDPATDKFIGIPNTTSYLMNTKSAYYNYVRGDRSSTPTVNTGTSTVLRTTGTLKYGNIAINISAGKFDAVGNPYASAIDIRKIDTSNLTSTFYVWDPKLTGAYGLGAYQLLYASGSDYRVLPGGGSYPAAGSIVDTLESGQGFFVRAKVSNGTVIFKEDAKTIGARTFSRGAGTAQAEVIFALLNIVDPSVNTLVDGAMAAYDNSYSSNVDFDDALKLTNTSENVSFKRSNILLAIERRSDVMVDDTLHLNMTGLRIKKYQWDVNIANMTNPGRTAILVDRFTNTTTDLNLEGVTNVQFDVTSTAASYAANRFMIVFKQIPMPTTLFTTISAIRNANKTIKVNYAVANETNIASYTIEQSNNGTTFTAIGTQAPIANNSGNPAYSFNDNNASLNNNWYRVKFTSNAGVTSYSAIAMVGATAEEVTVAGESKITVYPNPVVGGIVNLHLDNQAKGNYSIQITNSLGQIVKTDKVQVQTNKVLKTIKMGEVAKDRYQIIVVNERGDKTVISFIVQ
jgi:hypothetical protein